MKGLVSKNAKCRVLGCTSSIPWYGAFPGMPQSHCPRCGMITWQASDGCADFVQPLHPEPDLLYRVVEWFRRLSQ